MAEAILSEAPTDVYPHLMQITAEHITKPGYDYGDEFGFGLELILDGLERATKKS